EQVVGERTECRMLPDPPIAERYTDRAFETRLQIQCAERVEAQCSGRCFESDRLRLPAQEPGELMADVVCDKLASIRIFRCGELLVRRWAVGCEFDLRSKGRIADRAHENRERPGEQPFAGGAALHFSAGRFR